MLSWLFQQQLWVLLSWAEQPWASWLPHPWSFALIVRLSIPLYQPMSVKSVCISHVDATFWQFLESFEHIWLQNQQPWQRGQCKIYLGLQCHMSIVTPEYFRFDILPNFERTVFVSSWKRGVWTSFFGWTFKFLAIWREMVENMSVN